MSKKSPSLKETGSKICGKVVEVTLRTCKDYGFPSRNNALESGYREQSKGTDFNYHRIPLKTFLTSLDRCALDLKLEDGTILRLTPVLSKNSLAMDEAGYDLSRTPEWELEVSITTPQK